MIDSSPRPLTRRRLEQLVQGLMTRLSSSADQSSARLATLSEQLQQRQSKRASDLDSLSVTWKQQLQGTTTEWDEALNRGWDDAEMRSFKAVYDTAERERAIHRAARQQTEATTADAKKRSTDIEQRFLRSKDVPVQRLNDFRSKHRIRADALLEIEETAKSALLQRSLPPPPLDQSSELEFIAPDNTAAAAERLDEVIEAARNACMRLVDRPLAKFFESAAWAAICGGLFTLIAVALWITAAAPVPAAMLVAAGVSAAAFLAGIVGYRPWLKKTMWSEYPKVYSLVELGKRYMDAGNKLAVTENDTELRRLAAKRDEHFERVRLEHGQQLAAIEQQLQTKLRELKSTEQAEKWAASEQLTHSLADNNRIYNERLTSEQTSHTARRQSLLASANDEMQLLKSQMESLRRSGLVRLQIASQKALWIITRSRRWCNEVFMDWNRFVDGNWPDPLSEPVLPLGYLGVAPVLPEQVMQDVGSQQTRAPLLYSPLEDGPLTIRGDLRHRSLGALLRNLIMRALTSLPAGKVQVCVVDPPGLGRDFGWLMHLNDFDPQLATHRVWTQSGHIAKQLSQLAMAAEDFIQQSLRNRYENIVEYNREAGALAEPYRFLVWSSFPSGLDDVSWSALRSLIDSGARCGIFPILAIDSAVEWPSAEIENYIFRHGLHLRLDAEDPQFYVQSGGLKDLPVSIDPPASDLEAERIVSEVGRRSLLASRVEVPLSRILPAKEQIWLGDSSNFLDIPIGQSGIDRTHSLRLGVGTAQHAIIAGKTGSGKSSLLHALITSAVLKYSPQRLRMVLLDFKKGVEFQVLADAELPHTDIIGIESHREFGLSALEAIDRCMQLRGEAFRDAGVQDVASWNAVHPNQAMPRVLLIIDEFQELFVEEDKIASQASLILDRIVRQGRSFGVHAVLSSQTLAGAYSLPRTTLGQMAVRIALQCDESDAAIIFADDNPAAARLKFPGQAVYNDAGGRIEGNQPMQLGWLNKQHQRELFDLLPSGYQNSDPTTNRLGRCIVYDGNRPATWNATDSDLAIGQARKELNRDALWCAVGESVSIAPAIVFPLTRQSGRNVLIVASSDRLAASVLHAINVCFVKSHSTNAVSEGSTVADVQPDVNRAGCKIFAAQAAKPTDAVALQLPRLWGQLPCERQFAEVRDVEAIIASVYSLLQKRLSEETQSDPDAGQEVLLNLIQLGRLRSLRREEDYSFSTEASAAPDRQLEEILRDGPSCGIFTVIWADSFSVANRWLSRNSLREIEIRILGQMSSSDSTNLIDSIAASRLGDHTMLLFDEGTGQEQRFRPFAADGLSQMLHWASQG